MIFATISVIVKYEFVANAPYQSPRQNFHIIVTYPSALPKRWKRIWEVEFAFTIVRAGDRRSISSFVFVVGVIDIPSMLTALRSSVECLASQAVSRKRKRRWKCHVGGISHDPRWIMHTTKRERHYLRSSSTKPAVVWSHRKAT